MTLVVHPDPQEPAGGYAFFELPRRSLMGELAPVAIFDAYGERWLGPAPEGAVPVEPGPWQGDRHSFGPYQVYRHEGADWVRVGPEIVNRLEEYQPLKITVGMEEYAVTWPDDVPPRAGAAALGGIRPIRRPVQPAANVAAPTPAPAARTPPVEPAPAPEPEAEVEAPAPARPLWPVVALLLLLAAAGAAAWWFWPAAEAPPAPQTAAGPSAPDPVAATETDPCAADTLRALPGFAEIGAALRGCGTDVSPDTALALAEDFAARGDPAALYLIGTLYDGEVLDPRIETLIGLTFETDDTRAADYYHRAATAGSPEARAALSATCDRLAGDQSTLAKGAHDDFCG